MPTETPMRVLVVDDEDADRMCACRAVRSISDTIEVRCVGTVLDATDAVARWAPDVVLLDWRLGEGGESLDLLRILRQESPAAEVVVVTGMQSAAMVDAAVDAGAVDVVPKGTWDGDTTLHLRAVLRRVGRRRAFARTVAERLAEIQTFRRRSSAPTEAQT